MTWRNAWLWSKVNLLYDSLMKAHMGKVQNLLLPRAVYVCKANRHRIKIRQFRGVKITPTTNGRVVHIWCL